MIQITKTKGRKYITINNLKSLKSTSITSDNYLPFSKRFTPFTLNTFTMAKLSLENILTGKTTSVWLEQYKRDDRSTTYWFDYTDALFPDGAKTYRYSVVEAVTDINHNIGGTFKVTDTGLLSIYDDQTFTDKYIAPDVETIPATITYKPS